MTHKTAPCRVAVVAFDRISPFHLSVPCVVFGEAMPEPGHFSVQVCSADPQPLRSSAGFDISGLASLRALQTADAIIIPSWRDVHEAPPAALLRALRSAHARGAHIVGLCLGAYVLAAAGLLDGLRATTHWSAAADFAKRFPAIDLDPDVLYVQRGRLLTSAGTAAGIDCCLHLLRERLGTEMANRVARRLVVPPPDPPLQSPDKSPPGQRLQLKVALVHLPVAQGNSPYSTTLEVLAQSHAAAERDGPLCTLMSSHIVDQRIQM
ncbi:MAG: AraC family transcriptional regulator [Ideonella sp. MAG2]|nr:MAG: AraC family transcriptional regulator [Ideonella sp. MAG2]